MALVLTRRPGEAIHIGHDIVVEVVRVKADKVLLRIAAPRLVEVHRDTVYQRIHGGEDEHNPNS